MNFFLFLAKPFCLVETNYCIQGVFILQSQNNDIQPVVLDLNTAKSGQLNESWLVMFGSWIKSILNRMFGLSSIPVTVKGTPSQIDSFAKVLAGEKRYITSFAKYGLDDPKTYKTKSILDNAVKGFERETGIKYPFK